MPFFRKKLELLVAVRMVLSATIRRDYDGALVEVRGGGVLTDDDLLALKRELPTFALALWHLQFMDHLSRIGPQEMTKQFTLGLAAALQDVGISATEVENRIEHMMESTLSYLGGLETLHPDWVLANGQMRPLPNV